ncbi:uncharacterized protein J7T54_004079 [Emericellopsis cladophorae]|uniref:Methyltransferase domain-containing protein n=1 Tax=Emericellopsis cladophorae TaxID=2686198 RepID=A0A9P9Y0Y9_9HYPO|nr:uncharacterized protein J7T54_004079 [Emericellopsis cladophorae]KAI6781306.1 hypothetical protein J7T54_004079 [Emericellopsis cladophorae]
MDEFIELHHGMFDNTQLEYAPRGPVIETHSAQGRLRTSILRRILSSPDFPYIGPSANILDNICGAGDVGAEIMTRTLSNAAQRPNVLSVDPYPPAVEHVNLRSKELDTFDSWQARDEPERYDEGLFDIIVTIRQDTYYDENRHNMEQVYASLKPGGHAVFSVCPTLCYTLGDAPPPFNINGTDWSANVNEWFNFVQHKPCWLERVVLSAVPEFRHWELYTVDKIMLESISVSDWVDECTANQAKLFQAWAPVQQTMFKAALRESMEGMLAWPTFSPTFTVY